MYSICTQQIWKKPGNLHKYRLAGEKLVYIDMYFLITQSPLLIKQAEDFVL